MIRTGCKVAALYEYTSTHQDDLGVRPGDTLIVVDDTVGEGWIKAQNEFTREEGLVPVAYVEFVEEPPAPAAAPPIPSKPAGMMSYVSTTAPVDRTTRRFSAAESETTEDYNWDGDEFSDSDDEPKNPKGGNAPTANKTSGRVLSILAISGTSSYESFLTGQHVPTEALPKCYEIQLTTVGPMWEQVQPITCAVSNPKDMGKLMGMKKFVAYTVTPDITNESVMRRYKHFDWLLDRLKERFPTIAVPALPDKQLTGHDEELVRERTRKLKIWINKMSSHPVISQSEVFQHFLRVHEDKNVKQWKNGKRRAEKDPYKGVNSLLTYKVPNADIGPKALAHNALTEYPPYADTINKKLNKTQHSAIQVSRAFDGMKNAHSSFGRSLKGLGQALEVSLVKRDNFVYQSDGSVNLGTEIANIGDTYVKVGEMFGSQPEYDMEVIQDTTWVNCGVLDTIPDIYKGVKTCSEVVENSKTSKKPEHTPDTIVEMNRKLDLFTQSALAEVNQIQLQNPAEYRQMLVTALTAQVKFYRDLADKLEPHINALNNIDFSN